MFKYTMEVKKRSAKAGEKSIRVGEVAVFVPVKEDFISELVKAEQAKDDKGQPAVTEDGLPLYNDDKANFVQQAIFAYVKAAARNKLESGTATPKAGLKIAETWDELTAEGTPGNGAAALQLLREVRTAFAEWVAKQGKSEGVQKALNTYFSNKGALETASAAKTMMMAQNGGVVKIQAATS